MTDDRVTPRQAIEKAAAILHVHGLYIVQVGSSPRLRRELYEDSKVRKTPSADSEPELHVSTCHGWVKVHP